MEKPIPALYACYLLRSTIRHASLYVGSTPNPVRRLRQHNGESKGGAVRTSRDSLRPWEMTCLVTGFPSKVAALQFEWAWQNPHLTRHVSPNSRLTLSKTNVRYSPKTGRPRKRTARPRLALTDRLANLHQLLRSSSFERWPLCVDFYAEDVFRVWQRWTAHESAQLPDRLRVTLNQPSRPRSAATDDDSSTGTGVYALDVGYKAYKAQLDKSRAILSDYPACAICSRSLPDDGSSSLVCHKEGCTTAGHLSCFASSFLKDDRENLVPLEGDCPGCGSRLQWKDLVKDLSLRMRAPEDVEKIVNPKRARGKMALLGDNAADSEDDHPLADTNDDTELDVPLKDDWHIISDESANEEEEDEQQEEDRIVQSDPAKTLGPPAGKRFLFPSFSEPLIEDSEWDEAEFVT